MTLMQCIRWFVFALNLLFWLAGMGTLGVGLFLLLDPAVRDHMKLNTNLADYYTGVYILIAVGAVMSLLGFLGCMGALRKNQCLLVSFFILLFIIFCCQLAAGILAYTHQDTIKQYVEKSMLDAVYQFYSKYPKYTAAVNKMQEQLHCCGVHNYLDWLNAYYSTESAGFPELGAGADDHGKVPASCCNEDGRLQFTDCGNFVTGPLVGYKHFIWEKGCSDALYEKFYNNLDIVIGVAIGIGAFQLLGMVLTMTLCCWISKTKEHEYR